MTMAAITRASLTPMPVLLDMPALSIPPGDTLPVSMAPKLSCRPPKLASEILRKNMIPSEPGRRVFRRALVGAGVGGAVASFLLGGASVASFVVSAATLSLAVIGVWNMSYRSRAILAGGVATAGLLATTSTALVWGVPAAFAWLTVSVCWLSAALGFRAFHRGSKRARLLAGIGIASCAAWLIAGGVTTRFLSFETQ
ncbi:MAG: hypothetical protein IPK60_17940 [Sandaracinaceae bacterium]|nr:hypothetical protein [Sandaracinaceae bacterium]